ncbi:hypothetical protein WI665_04775 [Vibrio cholerae]
MSYRSVPSAKRASQMKALAVANDDAVVVEAQHDSVALTGLRASYVVA